MRERRVWFDLNDAKAKAPDVSVIGMPYDATSSRFAGAAHAPARLRAISRSSDPITRRGRMIEELTVRDFGNIDMESPQQEQDKYLELAGARLSRLPDRSFLLLLGGDNSVSIAGLTHFVRHHGPRCGAIWFDAHPDLFEEYDGNPTSHACALRRAMTISGLLPSQVVLLGTRSFSREEWTHIRDHEIETITAADWIASSADVVADRITARLSGLDAIYLAMDIDGFDSSCAPGTGYPMPGGVTGEAFFLLLERLFDRLRIRAMDITEIAPPIDSNDVTGFLGAQVILETFGVLAARGD